jgi:hypothetical protein
MAPDVPLLTIQLIVKPRRISHRSTQVGGKYRKNLGGGRLLNAGLLRLQTRCKEAKHRQQAKCCHAQGESDFNERKPSSLWREMFHTLSVAIVSRFSGFIADRSSHFRLGR